MGTDKRQMAYEQLMALAEKQGYVTFDNIMDCADDHSLPIQDFDWLSNTITTRGVLVYSEVPTYIPPEYDEYDDDDELDDFEVAYNRILELCPSLEPLITYVKKVPPPQKGELKQLKYQMYDGNAYARERFVEMYMKLALKAAVQKADTYDLDIEETIHSACIGLISAVDRNDPDLSHGFATYAKLWINQAITRDIPSQRPLVHFASQIREHYLSMYPILKEKGCLHCDELRSCSKVVELVSCHAYCSDEDARKVVSMFIPDESLEELLDQYTDEIEESYPKDIALGAILSNLSSETVLSDEDAYYSAESHMLRDILEDILCTLTPREERVIKLRYGFDGHERTLEEVGAIFNVTRERIRQIEGKALRKLRHPSRSKRIKDFL